MKRLIVCLILCMCFLSGCKKYDRIVPEEQLIKKNGLLYETGAENAFSGIAVRLYPNGNKYADIYHVDGKRHGRVTLYHKNGNVMLTGNYTDNKMSGEWIYWKDAKMTGKEIWKHGRQIQSFKYHDNGQLEKECKLEEDSLSMEYTVYRKDGKISAKTVFNIKNKTGKMTIPGKKPVELTLTLSDDKKHWNVNWGDKTVARIDTGTYVLNSSK